MAVIGVKSITGITSITNAAGGADVLTFHSNNTTERVRITAAGLVGIGTDNPGSNKLQVQGTSALYGNGGASATWGDKSYLGALTYDGTAQPVIRSASSKALVFQVNQSTEALKINSFGQIITGGGSGISFNNVGNSAFGSFFEVNGTHTIDHYGVLGVSGRTNTNNARVGLIQFLNTENSNTSSTGNAASRSLAHISVYADTSDSNAGDDCGGRIVMGTKGEAAAMNDLLFLTSDKTVGIQAIPAVGDMNSTATGGAALSDPKLYVYDGGTNGKYNLMIRCNAGSDADNTGSAIALNHSNDRGILIEGGRWSGNRSWGAIKAIDNIGRVTDGIAIRGGNGAGIQDIRIYTGEAVATTERLRITSAGYVSINASAPDHMFHIKGTSANNNPILAVESDSWVSGRSAALRLAYTDGNAREIRGHYEHGLQFFLNNGEALRINTDNKLQMGSINGNTQWGTDWLNIETGGDAGISIGRLEGGSPTSGQVLGSYSFQSAIGGQGAGSAEAKIQAVAAENMSGTTAATDMVFYTKQSGTGPGSAPAEAFRINAQGMTCHTSTPTTKVYAFAYPLGTGGSTTTTTIATITNPTSSCLAVATINWSSSYGASGSTRSSGQFVCGVRRSSSGSAWSSSTSEVGPAGDTSYSIDCVWNGQTLQVTRGAWLNFVIDVRICVYNGTITNNLI